MAPDEATNSIKVSLVVQENKVSPQTIPQTWRSTRDKRITIQDAAVLFRCLGNHMQFPDI